jgi:hypothetical protein
MLSSLSANPPTAETACNATSRHSTTCQISGASPSPLLSSSQALSRKIQRWRRVSSDLVHSPRVEQVTYQPSLFDGASMSVRENPLLWPSYDPFNHLRADHLFGMMPAKLPKRRNQSLKKEGLTSEQDQRPERRKCVLSVC